MGVDGPMRLSRLQQSHFNMQDILFPADMLTVATFSARLLARFASPLFRYFAEPENQTHLIMDAGGGHELKVMNNVGHDTPTPPVSTPPESSQIDGVTTSTCPPKPRFVHIDGEIGGSGYNETTVDVVTVPCPGADPVQTWARGPPWDGSFREVDNVSFIHNRFGFPQLAGDAVLKPSLDPNIARAPHLWVRQGLRKRVDTTRVLLYRHRDLGHNVNLDELAEDLLASVKVNCDRIPQHANRPDIVGGSGRPIFFIAHSVGGLVVKRALVMAKERQDFHEIFTNCYGVSFFGKSADGNILNTLPLDESGLTTYFASNTSPGVELFGRTELFADYSAASPSTKASSHVSRPSIGDRRQVSAETPV